MKYYTLQVKTVDNKVHEFKDIEETHLDAVKSRVWTQGVKVQTAPKAWELIGPFHISQVFLIQQEGKYGN